jgi:hypothetical protein
MGPPCERVSNWELWLHDAALHLESLLAQIANLGKDQNSNLEVGFY